MRAVVGSRIIIDNNSAHYYSYLGIIIVESSMGIPFESVSNNKATVMPS